VLVTDAAGVVVFDSAGTAVGADHSRWNDVYLTLRGEYGARTTALVPGDEATAVLHVAAPVLVDDRIVGVLTVAKSRRALTGFEAGLRDVLVQQGALLLAVTLAVATGLAWWFARSVSRLRRWADEVSSDPLADRELPPPRVAEPELDALARTMGEMRRSLAGRRYVEDYVRGLTHELKAPITAIRGAVELLADDMPAAERARFLTNLESESERLGDLVSRLMALAELEHREALAERQRCALEEIAADVVASRADQARGGDVDLRVEGRGPLVTGDPALLRVAVDNLVANALRFAPRGTAVLVRCTPAALAVEDAGPGVPAYALVRLTERFFSLADPATGRKSTGLGLAFVRQIATLHGGTVAFENRPDGGFRATLRFRESLRAHMEHTPAT
jgi:two-component system sensor histidine kinase CreC